MRAQSYSCDSMVIVRRHFLCVNKDLQKADMHMFPAAAECSGDRTAPRGALMPLVIICDTHSSPSLHLTHPAFVQTAAGTFRGAAGARAYLPAQWSR